MFNFTFFGFIPVMLFVWVAVLFAQFGNYFTVQERADLVYPHMEQNLSLPHLDNEDRDMFVFTQITDLHISMFVDTERYNELSEFCNINLKAIKPKLVLASGDLTDAISADRVIAQQFEEEWEMYYKFYTRCQNISGIKHWLDLRGNHDNFNINGYNSSNNYYPKFGAQNKQKGSYMITVNVSDTTKYAFVAVDATLDLGPKRILNFVGQLDSDRLEKLQQFQRSITESKLNGSIWFGHYPSSSILSSNHGFRQVASKSIAYLCGHFHTFGGLVPRMYSHHHSGMMELELADWKINRMYRVGVLDNGLFSFADVKHRSWPVIVVTNPKSAESIQPTKEPSSLMNTSSHIRILIFSPSAIELCEVKIDGGKWTRCILTGKSHPLYTAPWQPDLYSSGLHVLEVKAKDVHGNETTSRIEFALDGSRPEFPILARMALMIDITNFFKILFVLAVLGCVVPFLIIRFIPHRVIQRWLTMSRVKYLLSRKMWMFATIDSVFQPFALYTVYLSFLPWFVGHVIDGRIGVVFSWGTIFTDDFFVLPGTLTYFYGLSHIIIFNGILLFLLAYAADQRFEDMRIRNPRTSYWTILNVLFAIFFLSHCGFCYLFWLSYGTMAVVVNPMRTWSLFLAGRLYYKAKHLDELDFANFQRYGF